MDDFIPTNLKETTNEWAQRLVFIMTPLIYDGIQSIFNEAYSMCLLNKEYNKYLMTFQNCIRRIPKYNQTILETERNRMIEVSGCNYLEDLITCVHVSILKSLTCIRVGNRQKKIDISIPKLDSFIHRVYINVGRKVYLNTDLFMLDISPSKKQKNRRELEYIIERCILQTIRESLPYEQILRSYLDETEEHEEEEIEQEDPGIPIPPPPPPPSSSDDTPEFKGATVADMNEGTPHITNISFDDNIIQELPPLGDLPPIIPRKLMEEIPSSVVNNDDQFTLNFASLDDIGTNTTITKENSSGSSGGSGSSGSGSSDNDFDLFNNAIEL